MPDGVAIPAVAAVLGAGSRGADGERCHGAERQQAYSRCKLHGGLPDGVGWCRCEGFAFARPGMFGFDREDRMSRSLQSRDFAQPIRYCEQNRNMHADCVINANPTRAMTPSHLAELNREQPLAVEHGIGGDRGAGGPLLVIAGAGSGKTKTLAHRVAHLIENGTDPRRILLLTFSRRAAAEMTRRVERICSQVLGPNAAIISGALTWAGTFHGIGARLR